MAPVWITTLCFFYVYCLFLGEDLQGPGVVFLSSFYVHFIVVEDVIRDHERLTPWSGCCGVNACERWEVAESVIISSANLLHIIWVPPEAEDPQTTNTSHHSSALNP